MKEQLISFKTAKLAKEKKFNWRVRQVYDNNGKKIDVISHTNKSNQLIINNTSHIYNICSAPTQSLLQRFFRENHDIHIHIEIPFNGNNKHFLYYIKKQNKNGKYHTVNRIINSYNTYEEALEEGLLQALQLINYE